MMAAETIRKSADEWDKKDNCERRSDHHKPQ